MSKSWVRPQQATPLAVGQDQSPRSTGRADALANGQLPRNKLQWTRQQQQQQNSGSHADTSRAIQRMGGLENSIKPVKTGTAAPQSTGSRHRVYVRSSVPAGPETGAAAQPSPSQPQQQEPQQQRRHQQQTQQVQQQQHCQQQQNLALGPKRTQQAAPPVAKRRQVQQHGVQHAQAALPAGQQQQPQQHQLTASTKLKAMRKQHQQQQLVQVTQPQVHPQQHLQLQQLHQGLAQQQAAAAAAPGVAAASSMRAAAAVRQPGSAVPAPAAAPAAVAAGASSPAAPKRCSRAAAIAAARASVLQPRRNTRLDAAAAASRGAAHGSGRQAVRSAHTPGLQPAAAAAAAAGRVAKVRTGGLGRGKLLRPAQFITAPAQNGSNCQLVYAKNRNKLQRTAVKAAVAGTCLKWVNKQTAPHLAEAAAEAVASAAAARQQRLQHQQEWRQQLMQKAAQRRQAQGVGKRTGSAAVGTGGAGTIARRPLRPVKPLEKAVVRRGAGASATSSGNRGSLRLVRIGDQMFYQSAKGLRALAAASQQAAASSSSSAAAAGCAAAASAGAANIAKPALRRAPSISLPSTVAGRASARAAAAAAAAARSRRTLAAKRLASRGTAGIRRGRQTGRSGSNLCLYFCRFGECGRQQKGECALVHDASKVAVCTHWLAGSCSAGDKCKRQHKVVPELMPVCTYFLEGKCSNRDCPYLHIKVAADAPPCKDFLAGYCPKGAACTHKHLTQRMAKQLEQQQHKAQAVAAGAGVLGGQDGVAAPSAAAGVAPPPAAAAAAPAQADAAAVGEAGVVTRSGQQQQGDAASDLTPAAVVVAEDRGGPVSGAAAMQGDWAGEEALTALLPSASEDSEDWE